MDARIAELTGRQHGLVLSRQVSAAGITADEVRRRLERGEWIAVRRGVYTTASVWSRLDEHRGRPLLRVRAASLATRQPHVLSHESAALAHGLDVLRAEPEVVHLTRFEVQGGRGGFGVAHHRAPYEPWQVLDVDGVPTLDLARTAVDIARGHGRDPRFGVVACDAAMRSGVSRRQLREASAPMRNWRNITVVRQCVDLADAGAESVAESLARVMVAELGLGRVQTQFGLAEAGRTAWVDLRVGRHLIEVDGRVKYDGQGEGTSGPDRLWREKLRQDWLTGFKLGVSRVVWDDLLPRAWERTSARLRRDILDTQARFGTSIDDLAPYRLPRSLRVGR